jgi:hypothetical protein
MHSTVTILSEIHRESKLTTVIVCGSVNVSPDAFLYFMEILDDNEPHVSPETVDDLMLVAQECGYNNLIANLAPQRDIPRREEN